MRRVERAASSHARRDSPATESSTHATSTHNTSPQTTKPTATTSAPETRTVDIASQRAKRKDGTGLASTILKPAVAVFRIIGNFRVASVNKMKLSSIV